MSFSNKWSNMRSIKSLSQKLGTPHNNAQSISLFDQLLKLKPLFHNTATIYNLFEDNKINNNLYCVIKFKYHLLGKQINSSQRSIHPRVILHFTLFFCMYHLGSTNTPYLFKYQYQICTLTGYLCMHVSVVPLFFFSQKSADTSRIPS